jgi:hypothetical protein
MLSRDTVATAAEAQPGPRGTPSSAWRLLRTAVLITLVIAVTGPADDEARRDPATRCGTVGGAGAMSNLSDPGAGGAMTPYPPSPATDSFLRGATLELGAADRDPEALADQLRAMRDQYHINTVSVYGLAEWDADGTNTAKDALFAALARLDMRAVVRLEAYDPDTFAFDGLDVDRLLDRYTPLLNYVTAPGVRDLVAYLAVNMPLDDPRVQARLGGVNSPMSVDRQQQYAAVVVDRLRTFAARRDAGATPIYLGVFYGWDGSYQPPSYAAAGADGYFLTSYSYPGATVADQTATDAVLIDEPRRRATMRRFIDQYGDAPVIVEYGVHTAEGHGDLLPSQTAGLVLSRSAKRRALAATTRFYCRDYPGVRGTMYFGFNVYKAEGDPPVVLDFGLDR